MSDAGGFDNGGLGGRPTLPTGEPVMARWFTILLLVVVPVGLAITVWAVLSFSREPVEPGARRPPGDTTQTHERGQAALAESQAVVEFDGCVAGIRMVGDEGGIATVRRALEATCQLAEGPTGAVFERGLTAFAAAGGVVRVAVFELTGVDSTTRIEGSGLVIELNAKFQFDDAVRATPALVHELLHVANGFPGTRPVDAAEELEALRAQLLACGRLVFGGAEPRTCADAREVLDSPDPLRALAEAGYPL